MSTHTKARTNVSIDADLLRKARSHNLKLSPLLEVAITEKLKEETAARWLAENRKAIEVYNAEVGEYGVFSDGKRSF
jgi:post-segregation antitoxin (ccd killing protein)